MIAGSSNTQVSIGFQTNGFGNYTLAASPKYLRVTSSDFKKNRAKEKSKEVRSDLQPGSVSTVGVDVTGTVNYELSFSEFDSLLAAAIRAPGWVGDITAPVAESVTTTATTLTSTTYTFSTLAVGQWVSLFFVATSTQVLAKITVITGPHAITVSAATPLPVLTGVQCVISSASIRNGTTERYFSIEESHTDISRHYLYRDMKVSKMSIDVVSKQLVTGNIEFMGANGSMTNTKTLTAVASDTFNPLTASVNVGQILLNGAAIPAKLKSLKLSMDIGARAQDAIGSVGLVGIGSGTFNPTASIEAYFEDSSLYDLYNADTFFSLDIVLRDTSTGGAYVLRMPKCMLDKHDTPTSGRDADIMVSSDIAICSNDTGATAGERITLAIDRLGGIAGVQAPWL